MIRWALFFGLGIPVTALFSALALAGGLLGAPKGWFDWIHRTWSRLQLRLGGVEVVTEGTEHLRPEGPQVLAVNHQSLLDILALFAALPVSLRFVAKQELSRWPVFSGAMERAGHVFIDRADRRQAVEAMRRAGGRMGREGLSLAVFPEGTRSADGRLRRFRRGAFSLAIETGAELVPVAVEGGFELLPRGARRLRPGTLRIRCAEPVPLAGRDREDRDRVLRSTREAIADMLEEMRGEAGAGRQVPVGDRREADDSGGLGYADGARERENAAGPGGG